MNYYKNITLQIGPPLLHITTYNITSYYFHISSIFLRYYFLLLQTRTLHYFILLLDILLHITWKLLPYYFHITSYYYMRRITSYYYHLHYYVLHYASVFSHECNITTYYYNTPLLHSMNYYVLLPLLPLLRITFRGNLQMSRPAWIRSEVGSRTRDSDS